MTESIADAFNYEPQAPIALERWHWGLREDEDDYCMWPAPDGNYVRWADAAREIDRLRAALQQCRGMVGHPDNIALIDKALTG